MYYRVSIVGQEMRFFFQIQLLIVTNTYTRSFAYSGEKYIFFAGGFQQGSSGLIGSNTDELLCKVYVPVCGLSTAVHEENEFFVIENMFLNSMLMLYNL